MSDFAERLEIELKRRYDLCEDFAATPSSILLAVLNAVAEARRDHADRTAQPGQMPSCHVCGTTMNAERRVYEYLRLYVDFGNLTEINSLGAAGFQVVGILPVNAPYDAVVLLMRDITGPLARAAEERKG